MRKIVLASSSPRRKELLDQINLTYIIDPSKYEEDNSMDVQPEELVKIFSQMKAREVAQRHENAVIIGADTIVVLNDKVLGKPKHTQDAKHMLQSLSNNYHDVLTGITLIDTTEEKEISSVVKTRIAFRELSSEEINYYVETHNPIDKAGAYGIQEFSALFAERIEGDYFNIVGLPLYKLSLNLKQLGVNLLDYVKK